MFLARQTRAERGPYMFRNIAGMPSDNSASSFPFTLSLSTYLPFSLPHAITLVPANPSSATSLAITSSKIHDPNENNV